MCSDNWQREDNLWLVKSSLDKDVFGRMRAWSRQEIKPGDRLGNSRLG